MGTAVAYELFEDAFNHGGAVRAGVPENLAMGVGLIDSASATLLVAIFASNLPEATVGAQRMLEAGLARRTILLIRTATAVLLAVTVVIGPLSG